MHNLWHLPQVKLIGKLGVVVFFVLSGFLITYLLLQEESNTNNINVPKFYLRRILRIWPLYFLIVVLSIFILPEFSILNIPNYGKEIIRLDLIPKLSLYTFFLSNLLLSIYGFIPYASQLWSIGTEEQFYLFWPIFFKRVKKNRILIMILIIIFYALILRFLSSNFANFIPNRDIIKSFWTLFNINCMAIGGILGVLAFKKHQSLKYILNNITFISVLIIVLILISFGVKFPILHYDIYGIFFGIIIINFALNETIVIKLENPIFNYLGQISYGIYMYHPIAIGFTLIFARKFEIENLPVIYSVTILLTILLASISYHFFETRFLKLKNNFHS